MSKRRDAQASRSRQTRSVPSSAELNPFCAGIAVIALDRSQHWVGNGVSTVRQTPSHPCPYSLECQSSKWEPASVEEFTDDGGSSPFACSEARAQGNPRPRAPLHRHDLRCNAIPRCLARYQSMASLASLKRTIEWPALLEVYHPSLMCLSHAVLYLMS